jgi:predicted house-cleaning noncanonical NTP pyrophosphatase (MazG superfamily)
MAEHGLKPVTRTLEPDAYANTLQRKLQEEVAEYGQSARIEELADILEVVYALAAAQGVNPFELEGIRTRKRAERGGFERRIFLVETQPTEGV